MTFPNKEKKMLIVVIVQFIQGYSVFQEISTKTIQLMEKRKTTFYRTQPVKCTVWKIVNLIIPGHT